MTSRGRPAYVPTDEDRRFVEMMAGWAIPEAKIAKVLTIDPKNLCKHFAMELDVGHARLEAQLAQNLLRIAQGDDRQSHIATIFALKSRFGQRVSSRWASKKREWRRRSTRSAATPIRSVPATTVLSPGQGAR